MVLYLEELSQLTLEIEIEQSRQGSRRRVLISATTTPKKERKNFSGPPQKIEDEGKMKKERD